MSRMIDLLFATLMTLSIGASTDTSLSAAIAALGPKSDSAAVERVARFGCAAIPFLVRQLKPVESQEINIMNADRHPEEMRTIWSVAALRAVSGKDFYTYQVDESRPNTPRFDMLRAGDRRTKLFGIWASRGTVYFSTPDQQRRIIYKWKDYARSKSCRSSNASRDPVFWLYG